MTYLGLPENIYGHAKRLDWIRAHLKAGDRILEIGCGTGYMIVLPLLLAGWDVTGIDTDVASISYGQEILAARGMDPARLQCVEAARITGLFDVVVVSEVLEHLSAGDAESILSSARRVLKPGGRLLVTVPNGRGAFEIESFLWRRLRIGRLLVAVRIDPAVRAAKRLLLGSSGEYEHPSSLDCSPHVQRFTLDSVTRLINDAGFTVVERTGTVMIAGPISDLFLTGFSGVMRLNTALGSSFPRLASGFMLCALRLEEERAVSTFQASVQRRGSLHGERQSGTANASSPELMVGGLE